MANDLGIIVHLTCRTKERTYDAEHDEEVANKEEKIVPST